MSDGTGETRHDLAALAEAALLADLAVGIAVGFRLTPVAALGHVLAAVPMGVLAARRGTRTLAIGGFVALTLTFLFAGLGQAGTTLVSILWGGVAGLAHRRGWPRWRAVVTSVAVGWTVVATLTVAWFSTFSGLREVAFESGEAQWGGVATLLRSAGLDVVADLGDETVAWGIEHWWIAVPAFQVLVSIWLALLVRRLAAPALARIDRAFAVPSPGSAATRPGAWVGARPDDGRSVLAARGVGVAGRLAPVDLDLCPGEIVVVRGPNGSGKSTLLGVLGGRIHPDHGSVTTDLVGGAVGGVHEIGQRPESGVLGVTVDADLRWGPTALPDALVEATRLRLGVPDADREASGLSGGELQRLAVAAVALRRPGLVLSDESTAMLDVDGREAVRTELRRLAEAGAAVVHVSHLDADLALADRIVELAPAVGVRR